MPEFAFLPITSTDSDMSEVNHITIMQHICSRAAGQIFSRFVSIIVSVLTPERIILAIRPDKLSIFEGHDQLFRLRLTQRDTI